VASGGWAFGRGEGEIRGGARWKRGGLELRLDGWINELTDIGPYDASSGIVSTLGASFRGDDWTDPYFRSGGGLRARSPVGELGIGRVGVVYERQVEARLELDPLGGVEARPVRSISEGTDLRLEAGIERGLGSWLGSTAIIDVAGEISALADFGYTRWYSTLSARPEEPDAVLTWEGTLGGGFGTGVLPEQRLLLLGGRGTVPGYEFRPFAGDAVAFANLALSRSVWTPWLRVRGIAAAGWNGLGDAGRAAAERFGARGTGNVRTSLGAGLGLFYDLVRLDVVYGLDGGDWEWIVSVNPGFRTPL
jgi:hypothetical protein